MSEILHPETGATADCLAPLGKAETCPVCAVEIHCHRAVDGSDVQPEPGNQSICAGCFSFMRFDDSLKLHLMTDDEIADLPDEERIELQRTRRVLKKLKAAFSIEDDARERMDGRTC